MNEQTETIIRELSEKLGTTAEHLWGVLITQAPITGLVNLLFTSAWIGLLACAFFIIKRKTEGSTDVDAHFAWFIWCMVTSITFLVIGVTLNTTVAALINPEYWALMQILPN